MGYSINSVDWMVRGHLLGRLASRVQNQRVRKMTFECVLQALGELHIALYGPWLRAPLINYPHYMMLAALGMKNDVIEKLTGVSSFEPIEPIDDFFDGYILNEDKVKPPHSDTVSKVDGDTSTSSLGGHCSNWMVSNLKDKNGNNRETETEAGCTRLNNSGDFIAKYKPKIKTCFICNISDWAPTQKGPIGTTASKVDGDGSASRGSVHPCADNTLPVSAYWKFYAQGWGGGRAAYPERAGFVCFNGGYHTYSGSKWRTFSCDKGWVNCRLKKESPIREIENKDKSTVYRYGKSGYGAQSGVRTPAN